MLYSRISRVTTFYPISHYCSTDAVALFNLRGHAVQLQRSRCSIWCGILIEQCTRGDKRLKELLKLVAKNREELDSTLTDKQKETLEKFEECMNEMHSITERDAFSCGFRFGVQLMAEAFLLPIGEDE